VNQMSGKRPFNTLIINYNKNSLHSNRHSL
jgi:hypothetical protein